MSDDSKNNPSTKPTIDTIIPKHTINKKPKPSFISHETEQWPDDQEGAIASWKAAVRNRQTPHREQIMTALDEYDADARRIAKAHGLQAESTLDSDEAINADKETVDGSTLYLAYRVEFRTRSIRSRIEEFEKSTTDETDRSNFYRTIREAVALIYECLTLELRRHEPAILRGSDDSYNHRGASKRYRREIAERVQRLSQSENINQSEACRRIATEIGEPWKNISRWCAERNKSLSLAGSRSGH